MCVAVCPDRIIRVSVQGRVEIVGTSCMACSHCFCICPVEAIRVPWPVGSLGLKTFDEERCDAEKEGITPEALLGLMRSRRSCRVFEEKPVDLSLLDDLARVGSTAPSGTNSQGWQFILLPQREDVIRLGEAAAEFYSRLNARAANPFWRFLAHLYAGSALARYYENYYETVEAALKEWNEKKVDRLFHGAPSAIIVTGNETSSCPGEDALLATQNILLAAETCGVGTCLIGYVVEAARRDNSIRNFLRLGEKESIYSVIACGYPAVSFRRAAGRKAVNPRVLRLSEKQQA